MRLNPYDYVPEMFSNNRQSQKNTIRDSAERVRKEDVPFPEDVEGWAKENCRGDYQLEFEMSKVESVFKHTIFFKVRQRDPWDTVERTAQFDLEEDAVGFAMRFIK